MKRRRNNNDHHIRKDFSILQIWQCKQHNGNRKLLTQRTHRITKETKADINKNADDRATIEAELHRVRDNLSMTHFYKKYSETILKKDSDTPAKFWERFKYKIKIIMKKKEIHDYKVEKFSHDKSKDE